MMVRILDPGTCLIARYTFKDSKQGTCLHFLFHLGSE